MVSFFYVYGETFDTCFDALLDSPEDPNRKVEGDTIIFEEVQTGSSAVYQCNASNEYGYLLSNAFVNVLCESTPFSNLQLRSLKLKLETQLFCH